MLWLRAQAHCVGSVRLNNDFWLIKIRSIKPISCHYNDPFWWRESISQLCINSKENSFSCLTSQNAALEVLSVQCKQTKHVKTNIKQSKCQHIHRENWAGLKCFSNFVFFVSLCNCVEEVHTHNSNINSNNEVIYQIRNYWFFPITE